MSLVAGVPANVFDFGNLALVNGCIHTTRASQIEHTHTTAASSALGYNNSGSDQVYHMHSKLIMS
jgi:hypothetical protein